VRRPDPLVAESRRSIHEISLEEIVEALKNLVRDSLSIEFDVLVSSVARIFGFERTGNQIQQVLEDAFDELVKTHVLVLLDGRVSFPN
jgi:hypothetical protein